MTVMTGLGFGSDVSEVARAATNLQKEPWRTKEPQTKLPKEIGYDSRDVGDGELEILSVSISDHATKVLLDLGAVGAPLHPRSFLIEVRAALGRMVGSLKTQNIFRRCARHRIWIGFVLGISLGRKWS
jgi:hypothetical protein